MLLPEKTLPIFEKHLDEHVQNKTQQILDTQLVRTFEPIEVHERPITFNLSNCKFICVNAVVGSRKISEVFRMIHSIF